MDPIFRCTGINFRPASLRIEKKKIRHINNGHSKIHITFFVVVILLLLYNFYYYQNRNRSGQPNNNHGQIASIGLLSRPEIVWILKSDAKMPICVQLITTSWNVFVSRLNRLHVNVVFFQADAGKDITPSPPRCLAVLVRRAV